MLTVFIGYGGAKGEFVAWMLDKFLKTEAKMNVFVASPTTHGLSANEHNFKIRINQEMLNRHIAIFVCHEGSIRCKAMIEEIDFLDSNNLTNKMIIFSASDSCIPVKFRSKFWRPLHFTPEKPEESFCRLTNEIYRAYIEIMQPSTIVAENMEIETT
jgi:hypothetical protein